jgi:Na+-transporting methylmalonyl-CoA/oxaloacetate decarboxylase gamma subunit
MMPGDVMAIVITVLLPTVFLMYLAKRFFALREKQLEVEARNAAEKAAQYAASNTELEQRVRVLEQIVTDNGAQTAAQIEALRQAPPQLGARVKVPTGDAA